MLDGVFNIGLEQARREGKCNILEVQGDLSQAPKNYTLFLIVDIQGEEGQEEVHAETELYMQAAETLLTAVYAPREDASESYQVDSPPFFTSEDLSVRVFKGTRNELPIVIKQTA